MRCILLNPGPVSLSDAVRKAAVSSDLCHREPEYFRLQDQVRRGLLDVYGCDEETWASVLLGGSGTTALEAMLSSLLPREAQPAGDRERRLRRAHQPYRRNSRYPARGRAARLDGCDRF